MEVYVLTDRTEVKRVRHIFVLQTRSRSLTPANLRFILRSTMTNKPRKPETAPLSDSQVDLIIFLLGGVRSAAKITGIPPTTISGWRKFGFVPAHRQQVILDAAWAAGIKLTPAHFLKWPTRGGRGKAAA
jgi:hypothetical protein